MSEGEATKTEYDKAFKAGYLQAKADIYEMLVNTYWSSMMNPAIKHFILNIEKIKDEAPK